MGLFDTVICDYALPLPDFTEEELQDMNSDGDRWKEWNEVEWQTKDMGSMLDVYTIEDDGQIYLRNTEWIEDGDEVKTEEGELEKFEKTAEINFYQVFMGKKWDHWVEFKASVWKGELKELDLVEYKKEDNSDRLDFQGQMKESIEKTKSRGKLYKVYRYIFTKPLEIIRLILAFFMGITMKIERWLP